MKYRWTFNIDNKCWQVLNFNNLTCPVYVKFTYFRGKVYFELYYRYCNRYIILLWCKKIKKNTAVCNTALYQLRVEKSWLLLDYVKMCTHKPILKFIKNLWECYAGSENARAGGAPGPSEKRSGTGEIDGRTDGRKEAGDATSVSSTSSSFTGTMAVINVFAWQT